jgi:hypothetical protein
MGCDLVRLRRLKPKVECVLGAARSNWPGCRLGIDRRSQTAARALGVRALEWAQPVGGLRAEGVTRLFIIGKRRITPSAPIRLRATGWTVIPGTDVHRRRLTPIRWEKEG